MIVPVDPKADLVVALGGYPRFTARLCRIALVTDPVHCAVVPLFLDVDIPSEMQVHCSASIDHVAQRKGVPHLRNRIAIAQRRRTVRNRSN